MQLRCGCMPWMPWMSWMVIVFICYQCTSSTMRCHVINFRFISKLYRAHVYSRRVSPPPRNWKAKKIIRVNFKLFHLYFATYFSRKYDFLCYFLSLKNWKAKKNPLINAITLWVHALDALNVLDGHCLHLLSVHKQHNALSCHQF